MYKTREEYKATRKQLRKYAKRMLDKMQKGTYRDNDHFYALQTAFDAIMDELFTMRRTTKII